VTTLNIDDIPMIERMADIAKQLATKLKPNTPFEYVFVKPPFNTVFHLHLHAISLPKKHQSGWFKHLAL
jgi:diadenosine tetraphosphate (Ap4A) HIT family hydrolase